MSLSQEQLERIAIAARVSSALSLLGILAIIGVFSLSRLFRSPIHRIIFYNAFYNLFEAIATMISVSGPNAGNTSSLCRFQAFTMQMYFARSRARCAMLLTRLQVSARGCTLDFCDGAGRLSRGIPSF